MSKSTELRFKYKVKESRKYANNKQVAKDIIDELIPNFSNNWFEERNEMLANYRLYNNDIDQEVFEQVCNPLGINVDYYDEEVLPYNKTYQKIDVLLGEEYKRGLNYTLALLNPKAIDQKDKELKMLYRDFIDEIVRRNIDIAQLQAQGASKEEIEELHQKATIARTPKDIEQMTFLSELEILGNDIMNYGIHKEDIRALKNDGFKHALLSDKEIVYIGGYKGDPRIKMINPITCFYEKDPEEKYIQNGDWAGQRTVMSVQRILEMYGDQMGKDDRRKLEERLPGIKNPPFTGRLEYNRESTLTNRYLRKMQSDEFINDYLGSYTDQSSTTDYSVFTEYEIVTHVEWKWLREVLFHTYINEYGERKMHIIDANFKIPEDATKVKFVNQWYDESTKYQWVDEFGIPHEIEKLWVPRKWEGTRIGDDIYVQVREVPFQETDMDNPYHCKLSYHGLTFNSMNAKSISMMSRMKPFQFLFFVVLHQIKELIPKHIGPIQNFDTSMIDPNMGGIKGEGEEPDKFNDPLSKTLFYRKKGLNVYNSMLNNIGGQGVPTTVSRPQPGSVQNMSVAQDLNNLLELLGWIDIQIGMAAGVSPQREAQFSSNTNVSDNQQAIVQSSHITEHYFRKHNDLWKEVMEAYINLARQIWKGRSLKKQFVSQDGSLQTLDVEGADFDIANFGLFVTDSGRHEEYMNKMEELALTFMQNDGSIEQVSYILKARANGSSPEEVHKEIAKMQREQEERQQAMEQAKLESAEKVEKMRIDNREDEQAARLEEIDRKGMWDVRKAEITAFLGQADQDINDNNVPDQLEINKLKLAQDKQATDARQKDRELDLKEKDIESKERQARMKKPSQK